MRPQVISRPALRLGLGLTRGRKSSAGPPVPVTPSYVSTGTSDATTNTGVDLVPGIPPGSVADDLMIIQLSIRDNAAASVVTPAGWTIFSADIGDGDFPLWTFGKVHSGSETPPSIDWNATDGSAVAQAFIHAFRNVSSVPTPLEGSNETAGSGSTISLASSATTGTLRLACNFIAHSGNLTVPEATGETGGDWIKITEALTGLGGDNTICLHTADMSGGGTISGGTSVIQFGRGWRTRSYSLLPA